MRRSFRLLDVRILPGRCRAVVVLLPLILHTFADAATAFAPLRTALDDQDEVLDVATALALRTIGPDHRVQARLNRTGNTAEVKGRKVLADARNGRGCDNGWWKREHLHLEECAVQHVVDAVSEKLQHGIGQRLVQVRGVQQAVDVGKTCDRRGAPPKRGEEQEFHSHDESRAPALIVRVCCGWLWLWLLWRWLWWWDMDVVVVWMMMMMMWWWRL